MHLDLMAVRVQEKYYLHCCVAQNVQGQLFVCKGWRWPMDRMRDGYVLPLGVPWYIGSDYDALTLRNLFQSPEEPGRMPEWETRFRNAIYLSLLLGALLARPYQEPFTRCFLANWPNFPQSNIFPEVIRCLKRFDVFDFVDEGNKLVHLQGGKVSDPFSTSQTIAGVRQCIRQAVPEIQRALDAMYLNGSVPKHLMNHPAPPPPLQFYSYLLRKYFDLQFGRNVFDVDEGFQGRYLAFRARASIFACNFQGRHPDDGSIGLEILERYTPAQATSSRALKSHPRWLMNFHMADGLVQPKMFDRKTRYVADPRIYESWCGVLRPGIATCVWPFLAVEAEACRAQISRNPALHAL